jgi:hypothetical protein
MKKVILQRLWKDHNQSTGVLMVVDNTGQPIFASLCIERGDRDNQRNVSNVPAGTYPLILEYSPRFNQNLYELKNVPNRSECKIHSSNHWHQLNGCIAPGLKLKDIDRDGYYDVTNSKNTMKSFHSALKGINSTTIQIIDPK